jgi:nitrogen-specific signal transduction histidine kinase
MEKGEIYQALEDDFVATFVRELIPGILHNFANPLNGIMGRSKLLQRRIDEHVRRLEEQFPDTASVLAEDLKRMKNDIRSVSSESDSFFEMFRDVSGKFYGLTAKGVDRINLSELLGAEMRFANFYLDFKHEVRKEVQLDPDIPDIKGKTADLSLAFWRLIRFAMHQARQSEEREFFLSTDHDHDHVMVSLKYSGEAMPEGTIADALDFIGGGLNDMVKDSVNHGVILSLVILNLYGARVDINTQSGMSVLSIYIPYREDKSTGK